MIYTTVAFVSGVVLLQFQSTLPPLSALPLLLPLCLLAWRYRATPVIQLPVTLLGGFFWAAVMAHSALDATLPETLEGADLLATGVIESLPDVTADRTRFWFQVEQLADAQQAYPVPGRVLLNWYRHAPALSAGDRWQFSVRLKRPHGLANPGAFDYEASLFQKGIRATGYIRAGAVNRRLGSVAIGYQFERMRQAIAEKIDSVLPPGEPAGLVRALMIGDRSRISPAEWAVFRKTGTNHLVAISGLHIGIVSGIGFFLAGGLWRRSARLCGLMPAPQAGAVAALISGFCYAGLAGFAIPCVRALVMLSAVLGGVLCRRPVQPARSLCIALLSIVLIDPIAVISPGFWLSFGAVAVILLGILGRLRLTAALIAGLFKVQWVVALGLAPILLLLGFELPIVSPLVNLMVVPLFSLLLVPLTLFSVTALMLWPSLGTLLLAATTWLLGQTQWLLALVAEHSDTISLAGVPPLWMLLGMLLSILLLLLPAGIPGRWLGLLLIWPLLFYRPASPPRGEVWMTMLDVGQGLAIVLETSRHVLLYDAGPRFPSGFDTGAAVVVPYLRSRGVEKIDRIIVTNGDMDHRGGLATVLRELPSGTLLSGEPGRIPSGKPVRCAAGTHWTWDGVRFEILHPDGAAHWRGNDASCVLAVATAAGQLLLTGDIEAAAEERLIAHYGERLASAVVTVPHHGSAGSSGTQFIAATGVRYGLISAGYRNRYGFPKAVVRERWQGRAVTLLNTAEAGAISLRFTADGRIEGPFSYRKTHRRYWMTTPF
ncbi:DNA internalization-related competence protein ComEC/Rec2 [Sedimenticola hydrogenitrophicus]|uniref:DNA internalization-related competence protein ComEC/Rec2 n=1 Tax=Sedimenticola hydrogenitrophicus TaxID=2967975 RepID=UPI0021A59E14|nr:DNA internalization-related competence protein ComEC/Rec2 [Sedimenticola hydrogenitrophicus]